MTTQITRWNPFREMMTMQNMMDRLFEDWRPLWEDGQIAGTNPLALDVHEEDNRYIITTELPGVKAENINVRQEGDYLLIEAETRDEMEHQPKEGRRALVKERRYGRYSRRIRLPQNVNFDKAEATYEDGVLKLQLPKAEEAVPRIIQVKHGSNGNRK